MREYLKYTICFIICCLWLQCKETDIVATCDCQNLYEGGKLETIEGTLHFPSNSNSAYSIILKKDSTLFLDMPALEMYAICSDSLFFAQIKSNNLKDSSYVRITGEVVYAKNNTHLDVYLCNITLGNNNYQRQPIRIKSIKKL